MIIINEEWINSIPKIVNSNGCWIPLKRSGSDGYVQIMIDLIQYRLHRLVVSIYYNLNYHDQSWDARHNESCDKACFWIEHLKFGTSSDNSKDAVLHGTHRQTQKEICPKCLGKYKTIKIKTGWHRGEIHRHCPTCRSTYNAELDKRNR